MTIDRPESGIPPSSGAPERPDAARTIPTPLPQWLEELTKEPSITRQWDDETEDEIERPIGELARELIERELETARRLATQLFESLPALPYERARAMLVTTEKIADLTDVVLTMSDLYKTFPHWFPPHLHEDFAYGQPKKLRTTRTDIEEWKASTLPIVAQELLNIVWKGLQDTQKAATPEESINHLLTLTLALEGCQKKFARYREEFPEYAWPAEIVKKEKTAKEFFHEIEPGAELVVITPDGKRYLIVYEGVDNIDTPTMIVAMAGPRDSNTVDHTLSIKIPLADLGENWQERITPLFSEPDPSEYHELASNTKKVRGREFDRRWKTIRMRLMIDSRDQEPVIEIVDEKKPPALGEALLKHRIWPTETTDPIDFREIFRSILTKVESDDSVTPEELRKQAYSRMIQRSMLRTISMRGAPAFATAP